MCACAAQITGWAWMPSSALSSSAPEGRARRRRRVALLDVVDVRTRLALAPIAWGHVAQHLLGVRAAAGKCGEAARGALDLEAHVGSCCRCCSGVEENDGTDRTRGRSMPPGGGGARRSRWHLHSLPGNGGATRFPFPFRARCRDPCTARIPAAHIHCPWRVPVRRRLFARQAGVFAAARDHRRHELPPVPAQCDGARWQAC